MTIADVSRAPVVKVSTLLPPMLLPLMAVIFYFGGIGPNAELALLALGVLLAGSYLLWRPGEPPVLLVVFGYQWLGAALGIFYSNFMKMPISEFSLWGGQTGHASFLSCIGLLFLGLGMRLGAGPRLQIIIDKVFAVSASRPVSDWFKLYVASFVLAALALEATKLVPGLAQPLLAVANLKWAFYFALAYATFCNKRAPRIFFFGVFILEFALGVGGFFSDFRTVLFFTLFALMTSGARLEGRALFSAGVLGLLMITLAIVWTGIKIPYRQLISGGDTQNQVVAVGYTERMKLLFELIGNLDGETMTLAAQQLVHRLSYVDFFGVVLDTVPSSRPHENGRLWLDAISRPLMPRILFPSKTVIDDTARTNYYTKDILYVTDGTSISIGYIGESYIDFGQIGMMLPILLLGWLYGRVYRWQMTSRASAGPLGMGFACSVMVVGIALESSITKTFGGLAATTLIIWLAGRYVIPRYVPWVLVEPPPSTTRPA
jgi:hypothetical protein